LAGLPMGRDVQAALHRLTEDTDASAPPGASEAAGSGLLRVQLAPVAGGRAEAERWSNSDVKGELLIHLK